LKLLLDTHALLWWVEDHPSLSLQARERLMGGEDDVFVSAVSAMEITTKFRLGKLPEGRRMAEAFEAEVAAEGFQPLPVSLGHAQRAGSLPIAHKDPFDRLLIAQAIIEGMTLVSNERGFDAYGVKRLW
jgi:PIN domain nuclease of toxin-antitoxin system